MRKGATWVALLCGVVGVAGVAPVVQAGPRPKALASVAPFAAGRGDEELAYFGPEVGRAVTVALEALGIDVGAAGASEWTVVGRIETVDAERVRLTAVTRGHTVTVEGAVENLDQLAAQLGAKLAPLLSEGPKGLRVQPPLVVRENKPSPLPAADKLKSAAEIAKAEAAKLEAAKAEAAKAEAAKAEAAKAEAAKAEAAKVEAAKVEPAKAEPAKPETKVEIYEKPKSQMPDVLPAYPPSNYHPWGGFVSGRVVAHSIADPPASYVGTGVSATQALYGFLGRRLRLAVVPTGVGITPPSVAADEGWRAASRSVVMARIENLEYLPSSMGVSVRLRLHVVVVKEGRTVFRRVADSPLSDPSRRTDPIYQAVTGALETLVGELASVLGG